jgi:hypothetical protein
MSLVPRYKFSFIFLRADFLHTALCITAATDFGFMSFILSIHIVLLCSSSAGHFTQLVWVSTRHFGVGKARSRTGKVLVVAHYRPPGNISGLFQQNVLPPLADYDAEMTSESGSESSTSRSTEYCT